MNISKKIIGWFSYSDKGTVFCDGDSCIIASSKELMKEYIMKMSCNQNSDQIDIIKKLALKKYLGD